MSGRGGVTLLAVLAFFVLSLAWIADDRPQGDASPYARGSVHDTSPAGASLALRYLQTRPGGAPVRTLARAVSAATVERDAVVFRIRPQGRRGPAETAAEDAWVRGGGRLVIATADGSVVAGPVAKVFPAWPAVQRLQPVTVRKLELDAVPGAHAVFAAGEAATIARAPRGRGELVLLACPEVLENRDLARADHLALLETLAGQGRAVYFDERAHGEGEDEGLFALLVDWGLGPALVLGGLAGGLAFWRARTRLGAPDAEPIESRADAVDLVDSLGRLYARTLSDESALALYREHLARTVARRTGLRGGALEASVSALVQAGEARPAPGDPFSRRLAALTDAFRRLTHAHPR